ncbi:antirestriction protein [Hahella ganghwensis]|uniref:antirestriction protein n=1 Tax=Hahella ganghwensis TaxID=286420 RepID=UPI00036686BB|nr:antirestriction protein [Hahella ganghwensis]
MSTAIDLTISPRLVSESERLDFLFKFFGSRLVIPGQNLICNWMKHLCDSYSGYSSQYNKFKSVSWSFYELSNGGFYLAPRIRGPVLISNPGNYFEGSLSPDAAGIVSTLFGVNHLIFEIYERSKKDREIIQQITALNDRYYLLRDYAKTHYESSSIMRAID